MNNQIVAEPGQDGMGQGAISPHGFFEQLVLRLLEEDEIFLGRYIAAAAVASTQSPALGNQTILDLLSTVNLAEAVAEHGEPERTDLLEALRVMGIRLRRFALNNPAGFKYMLQSFLDMGEDGTLYSRGLKEGDMTW
ncbi:MAG: hypothetical protein AAF567_04755 [Actinomycetota bacterium]